MMHLLSWDSEKTAYQHWSSRAEMQAGLVPALQFHFTSLGSECAVILRTLASSANPSTYFLILLIG